MLENIINKTKIGLVAAAVSFSLYGCGTTRTSYPLANKIGKLNQIQYCDEEPYLYCDDKFVYPVMVVKFK